MELDLKYELLLVKIKDAENERLLRSEVKVINHLYDWNLNDYLSYLIEADLIEFDKQDDAYYLTYEGYEKVEDFKVMDQLGADMAQLEYEHSAKRNRIKIIPRLIIGVFLLGVFYFVFFGFSTNRNHLDLENVLNQDVLEEIKQEIEFKEDSIRRVEDEENLNFID